jgi:hypothetical protein
MFLYFSPKNDVILEIGSRNTLSFKHLRKIIKTSGRSETHPRIDHSKVIETIVIDSKHLHYFENYI